MNNRGFLSRLAFANRNMFLVANNLDPIGKIEVHKQDGSVKNEAKVCASGARV